MALDDQDKYAKNHLTYQFYTHKMTSKAKIELGKCLGSAPSRASITFGNGVAFVVREKCMNCIDCIESCPNEAIIVGPF